MATDEGLSTYLRIILKRWWLFVIITAVTLGFIAYRSLTASPVYVAAVRMQVSAPEPAEVSLYGGYARPGVRDEIAFTKYGFNEILMSNTVAWRTIEALNLNMTSDEILRMISVQMASNADFVVVTVTADDAELAKAIANTHVDAALRYLGSLRAKPAKATREFLEQQLALAKKDLNDANEALKKFRMDSNVGSLDREIESFQSVITQLRIGRDTALGKGQMDEAARLDALIAKRESELQAMVGLSSQYSNLTAAINQAQEAYGLLLNKETEAKLKENQASNVGFIQIVEPARTPAAPTPPRTTNLLMMGALASIAAGILISFLLEYFGGSRAKTGEEKSPDEKEALEWLGRTRV
ncbi:MAG: hypothetical protein M1343_10695 [Chloroflexi bacterium]|nr:hypothetical protein [Chloroflexota bacterium]MDA8187016.1 hypothetical protein [Dehalococcoidales bacterium]